MFNRYWREFPWWLQLLQFVLLTGILFGFAIILIAILVPRMTGLAITDMAIISENSSRLHIDGFLLMQFFSSFLGFLAPPLLFSYLTHPRPTEYLGLRAPGKPLQWLLSAIIILSALPIMLTMTAWLQQFDFGASVKKAQEQNDSLMKGLMKMDTTMDLVKTFIVVAILPAVGEELFFRGVVMRLSAKILKSPILYIVLSAVLFAWMHSNLYGLPAIFMAGIILGGIYYLTGSLWCSILAHLINNGLQIVLSYMAKDNLMLKNMSESNEVPWQFPAIGIPVFAISCFLLWKSRTPLAKNWADDFAGEKPESTDNFTA